MIARTPNEISGIESDLDVCFLLLSEKGKHALEALTIGRSSTIQLRNHSFSPRIQKKNYWQRFSHQILQAQRRQAQPRFEGIRRACADRQPVGPICQNPLYAKLVFPPLRQEG